MARVIVGDLLTGRRLVDLPYESYSWSKLRNRPETLSASVTLTDPDIQALQLRNVATPAKTLLAIVEEVAGGEWYAGAGQMNRPSYNRDKGTLTLSASGVRAYFGRRNVLPPSAASVDVTTFLIPDPLDATKTIPNPALTTSFSGVSWGTLIKKLLEQAMAWPSGNLPMVLPADIAGTRTKSWEAIDFKSVDSAIADIIALENGPDLAIDARAQADRRGVEWVVRTGTDTEPKLRSASVHRWDLTADQTSTRGLVVDYNADLLGSLSWATGGRSTDVALVERASNSALTAAGFPLMEIIDTTHTDVSERATLARYANDNLAKGQGATELWKFEVRKDVAPFLGQYNIGDYCDLIINGDPYIPDSPPTGYRREIAGISSTDGDWVTITTMEV